LLCKTLLPLSSAAQNFSAMLLRVLLFCLIGVVPVLAADRPPNIVYIMSDELSYFELGHMGNPYIKTPNIDRFAANGLRFTNALAAAPVCGPLRGCMMTGKHAGHASVRANDGGTPLRAEEVTIATILKTKGYATGGYGKWGAGGRDSTGVPEKHGFDDFYGYYDQVHAHSYYPPYLIRNGEEVPQHGNVGGRSGQSYSHYTIMDAGMNFIRINKDRPFFAYFPITPTHGMFDIPAKDPAWRQYKDEAWMKDPSIDQEAKNYAAMATMVDNDLGRILALLDELGLRENTIVFFTGDNGGQQRFKSDKYPHGFFGPNVNPATGEVFRGEKGNLYEGGLKIPYLVQWPAKIKPGRVSDFVFYQVDVLATLADIAGLPVPVDTDGASILPELLDTSVRPASQDMFYWEYKEQTAVRHGRWKAIQPNTKKAWELYDLQNDIEELNNLASAQPGILAKMKAFAAASHEPVRPGTFLDPDRTKHERDRQAKWGTSGENLQGK
jgi:arylsulfatase A-like enzyme